MVAKVVITYCSDEDFFSWIKNAGFFYSNPQAQVVTSLVTM
jgi:succinate dehydrogenase flavin-adding protein (antitoxin of CptAB toxin-antitoxin module)